MDRVNGGDATKSFFHIVFSFFFFFFYELVIATVTIVGLVSGFIEKFSGLKNLGWFAICAISDK